MVKNPSGFAKGAVLTVFLIFSVTGCVLGLALCLVKTPEVRAQQLAQAGRVYFEKAQDTDLQSSSSEYLLALSRQALLDSIAINAYNADNWLLLSSVLNAQGSLIESIAARDIVASLDSGLLKKSVPRRVFPAFQLELTQLTPQEAIR